MEKLSETGNWTHGRRDGGGRKRGSKAANLIGSVTWTGITGTKRKGKGEGKAKGETRHCYDCGEPRRTTITRCGKRMDPRSAFHYFAEGDEDEQVSGGLNHLVHETLEEINGHGRKSLLQSTRWRRTSCRGVCSPKYTPKKQRGPRMETVRAGHVRQNC